MTSTTDKQPSDQQPGDQQQTDTSQRWKALAVCLVAGGMTLLDVSIVNVALPSIRQGLGAGDQTIQWVVAGYSLAFGVMLVPAGRLGDARSRRQVFIAGVIVFTLASAACGAAQSSLWIALARVVQGFGGGMITPQTSGFIQNLFKGKERGKAFGLFGMSIGVSTAIGPLLGGALVQLGGADFGWRLVFYVNAPIGVILVLLAMKWLPKVPKGPKQSLDPVGVLLFGVAVLLVLLPVVEGKEGTPLSERPWWLLGVAAAIFVVFYLWERWWTSRDKETLVDLSLARVKSYVFGISLGTLYFAGFTSIFIIITLYLQSGLKYTALQAGATQMPFAIGSAVAAYLSGRVVDRFGRALVVAGLVLVTVGLVLIDVFVPMIDGDVGLKLAPFLLIAGLGSGMVISPNVTLALDEVVDAKSGAGGGLLQTAQRTGSAVGVAIVLAQFFQQVSATDGDYGEAISRALHTTVGLVVVALLIGLVDLLRRRVGGGHNPEHKGERHPHAHGGAHLG